MPRVQNIPHQSIGGPLVVHAHVHRPIDVHAVDGHERNVTHADKFDDGAVRPHPHGDEAVHRGPAHGFQDPSLDGRDEGQGKVPLLTHSSHTLDNLGKIRILQRLRNRMGQQKADGSDSLGRQRAGHGIRNVP